MYKKHLLLKLPFYWYNHNKTEQIDRSLSTYIYLSSLHILLTKNVILNKLQNLTRLLNTLLISTALLKYWLQRGQWQHSQFTRASILPTSTVRGKFDTFVHRHLQHIWLVANTASKAIELRYSTDFVDHWKV